MIWAICQIQIDPFNNWWKKAHCTFMDGTVVGGGKVRMRWVIWLAIHCKPCYSQHCSEWVLRYFSLGCGVFELEKNKYVDLLNHLKIGS